MRPDPAADLAAIAAAAPETRPGLVDDFLATHRDVLRRITALTLRYFGLGERLRPDVESEVWMAALEILREARPDVEQVASFEAFLTSRSRRAVSKMLDSPATTGVAGTTYVRRKQRSVARSRSRLRALLGADPDTDALLEFHNEQVATRVSDPVRQGAFVTREDLQATPHTVLGTADSFSPDATTDPDRVAEQVSCRALARTIVDRCDGTSPGTGKVARAWLGGYLDGSGDVDPDVPVAQVAADLGLEPRIARRYMEQVRAVALEVATEYGYGLDRQTG